MSESERNPTTEPYRDPAVFRRARIRSEVGSKIAGTSPHRVDCIPMRVLTGVYSTFGGKILQAPARPELRGCVREVIEKNVFVMGNSVEQRQGDGWRQDRPAYGSEQEVEGCGRQRRGMKRLDRRLALRKFCPRLRILHGRKVAARFKPGGGRGRRLPAGARIRFARKDAFRTRPAPP